MANHPASAPRAAIYVRASLDPTGEAAAISRQEADCRDLARARGYDVAEVYRDNDTSATKGRRPGWEKLLADVHAGRIDVVVSWHLDRMARRLADLERVIALGIPVATVTGDLDLSNDQGRLLARMLGVVAQGEVERKGARQRRANQEAAAQGRPGGGRRPFGYEVSRMALVPAEAEAVRDAYSALLAGSSLRGIARAMNDAGHTSTAGKPWRPDSVRDVLASPRYAGLRSYRGAIQPTPGQWPAIVAEETWRAALAVLNDPTRKTTPGRARRYLLSGMARCWCGLLVKTGATQRGALAYKCSGPVQHLVRAMAPLDDYVIAYVLERLGRADARDLLVDSDRPNVEEIRAELLALRTRLFGLADLVADGTLTPAEVHHAAGDLRKRIAAAEGRITDAGRVSVLAPLLDAADTLTAWEGLDLDQRRTVVDTLATVRLLPPGRGARTLDPATVEITPRRM